jgi:TP901 family phage tail tape measure protein
MGDKVSSFTITFDGEAGTVNSVLAKLKSQIKSDVADIQATANKVQLFADLQKNAGDIARAFFDTRQRVQDLRTAIDAIRGAGGTISRELTNQMKDAERAATAATSAYVKQRDAVVQLRGELARAGVDTRNLVAEQQRLAAAAAQAAAKQVLGFKTIADVEPEISRLRAAFTTLATSGTLSTKEIALAQQQLNAQIKQVRESVTGVATAAKGGPLTQFFSSSIAPALALGAAVGGVSRFMGDAIQAAHDYQDRLAQIGSVTNLTRSQLDDLGGAVQKIAEELGLNLNESLQATQELLRSGVPKDNVLEVLRTSAEAAKAGLTDLGTGVRAANLLLDNFGAEAGDLPTLFDKIVRGGHDGGASLKEFADSAGPLLNVARAAGVSFDDLLATLTVLVDKSGNAGKSMQDLTKIISTLQTADAQRRLQELGISGGSLVDIFQQIGQRGLSLSDVLNLQLAPGGAKSAASLAALTNNASALPGELARIQGAAGEASRSLAQTFDSPAERAKRFDAALDGLQVRLGNLLGRGSSIGAQATDTINRFNTVLDSSSLGEFATSLDALVRSFLGVPVPTQAATKATAEFNAEQRTTQQVVSNTAVALENAKVQLDALGKQLADDVKALQEGAARDIADAQARADAQIAALDRTAKASAATAAATLDIQKKLAADRLAIIVKEEADITAAANKAAAARLTLARQRGEDEKKVAAEIAQARINALAPVLQQYQAHYNALVQQAQGYAAKLEQIDRERADFNRGIEQTIFETRISTLSAFDQYVAKAQEADRLVSEARKAGAQGDAEAAKQYTQQAIQLANSLAEVTDQNGVKIVTNLQAQTDKQNLVAKAAKGYNDVLDAQAQAAKDGADATQKGLDAVIPKLKDLQARYDDLKKTVDAGLQVQVKLDEASARAAMDTINDIAKDRVATILVRTVTENGTPVSPDALPPSSTGGGFGEQFARGGRVVRRFAAGGRVFTTPSWMKVPGSGDADTVPAMLREGSFVVRKSASRFYGDAAMSKLARGYAAGGTVTKQEISKFAQSEFGFDPFATGNTTTGGGTSFQTKEQTPISFDARPVPDAWLTAAYVVQYAREMLNMVGQNNPLLGTLGPSLLDGIRRLLQNPSDQNLIKSVLQAAETIGANPYIFQMWGKTTSSNASVTPTWFVDWMEKRGFSASGSPGGSVSVPVSGFAARFFGQAIPAAGNPITRILFGQRSSPSSAQQPTISLGAPFAEGGAAGTDSVPAMLTPGEFVVSKPAVDRVGAGLLEAVNQMRIGREDLSYLLEPPRVRRFETGGMVSSAGASAPSPAGRPGAGVTNNVYMQVSAADVLSEQNLRRYFVPAWNNIQRRANRT